MAIKNLFKLRTREEDVYQIKHDDVTLKTNLVVDQVVVNTGSQELTESGAVNAGVESIELNHATTIVAATIADLADHKGLLVIKNTSASGTAAHTVTASSGTLDGTNTVATLNAPDEALVLYIDSAGNGTIVENVGSVALS